MPRLTRWALRLALVDLMLGFTLGGLILCSKGSEACPPLWSLRALHIELLTVGWMAQLALGVAYWILPRYAGGVRGASGPAWAAWGLLNLGLWTAGVAPALSAPTLLLAAGRMAEALAVLVFATQLWPRAKGFGT